MSLQPVWLINPKSFLEGSSGGDLLCPRADLPAPVNIGFEV
jgi:hypothetical protein